MPIVTVAGAHGSTVSLTFDSAANAAIAQRIAAIISAGVSGGSVAPADNAFGPPPPVPAGKIGEFVQSQPGVTVLPPHYDDVVDSASSAVIFGSGDANEQVLAGSGNLSYFATGGSGTVVGGGGNDLISIPKTDAGAWLIELGNGNDTINALGSGNDTIGTGSGHNTIQLGSGKNFISSGGTDTIVASSGSETVAATGPGASDVVYGNSSRLTLIAGGGVTVFGGTGSDTVYGGAGPSLLFGGAAGNNYLQAGSGPATLFGGGNGDELLAAGSAAQALHASTGNETLFGGLASGADTFYGGSGKDQIAAGSGNNTVVAGSGAATVTANAGANNLFQFIHGAAGGTDLVQGLTDASQVLIKLTGYGPNEASNAVAGQSTDGSSVTVTLSDSTKITFQNITHLTGSNFTT